MANGNHELKPLKYDYDALDGISEQVVTWHHDKHHSGYVSKRNEVEEKLQDADRSSANANYSEYGELKRRETFNANGMILHEIYWDVMGGDGTPDDSLEIVDKLASDFGSFEAWQEDFTAASKVALGWVIVAYDYSDGTIHNYVCDTHNQGGVWNTVPLIAIDVFEHAYYYDNGPDRGAYIEAFLRNLNWEYINRRFTELVNPDYDDF